MTGEASANKISSELFRNVSEKSVYFHKKTSFQDYFYAYTKANISFLNSLSGTDVT